MNAYFLLCDDQKEDTSSNAEQVVTSIVEVKDRADPKERP